MKRLILPACVAALFHALFFLMPLPSAPVPPSASTHGTTITVSMSVPSVQSVPAAQPEKMPEPVKKETPKEKQPIKPRKKKPHPTMKKKAVKPTTKEMEPVTKASQPSLPVENPDPEPTPEEPVAQAEPMAQVQETTEDIEETTEPSFTPAVGGTATADPTSIYAPEPNYPKAAIRRGYQGVVLLEILVDGEGEVKDVKVKTSSGHSVLDRSAVKGVKAWRFSATGAMDATWVTLPVRFELRS